MGFASETQTGAFGLRYSDIMDTKGIDIEIKNASP